MAVRTCAVLALLLVGCGGKVLDGTCSPEDGGTWSCGDASGVPPHVAQCPSDFVPLGGACPSGSQGLGLHSVNGQGGNLAADCLDCGGDGTGTYWTCTEQGWQAAGFYACKQ